MTCTPRKAAARSAPPASSLTPIKEDALRFHLVSLAALAVAVLLVSTSRAQRQSPTALWQAFTCIHRHEGAWNANTGNGYYGGLQMDSSFMRTYGGDYLTAWGTADNWPPAVQIAVAMRAYLSGRGFYPWPNTARMCGLI